MKSTAQATQLGDSPYTLTTLHQKKTKGMEIANPKIPTGNKYSIFAKYVDSDQDIEFYDTETNKKNSHATQDPIKLISTSPSSNQHTRKYQPYKAS